MLALEYQKVERLNISYFFELGVCQTPHGAPRVNETLEAYQ